jgi:hypothetical protein
MRSALKHQCGTGRAARNLFVTREEESLCSANCSVSVGIGVASAGN